MMWKTVMYMREICRVCFFFLSILVVFLPQSTEHKVHWMLARSSDNNYKCFEFQLRADCWCIYTHRTTDTLEFPSFYRFFTVHCNVLVRFDNTKYHTNRCVDSSPTLFLLGSFVYLFVYVRLLELFFQNREKEAKILKRMSFSPFQSEFV